MGFSQRLFDALQARSSALVVGIDPHLQWLPGPAPRTLDEAGERVVRYFTRVIELVADDVIAVKLQLACFEALGVPGWTAYQQLIAVARAHGLLVIADAKRGDIGSTATAYARAHLASELLPGVANPLRADALTVNPLLGSDSLAPLLDVARAEQAGLFCLVKTSNPGSSEIQDLKLSSGEPLYQRLADIVAAWGAQDRDESGYSLVGAVTGATHPALANVLRSRLANVPLLLPGIGAQGASPADLASWFDRDGLGAIVPAARAIAFAWREGPYATTETHWESAVSTAARSLRESIERVRRSSQSKD
jgi:orotidine-5'-phosphate decarboxylase